MSFLWILLLQQVAVFVTCDGYSYKEYFFQQRVDHFDFSNQDKFTQRYILADQYWNSSVGPIFFYAGNEGDIVTFVENTGFMWDIAPEFSALLVFAEHRYYGQSLPCGNESTKDVKHLGYLSSEQALADFAELLTSLKKNLSVESAPVVAFGGSYGGMLAAWGRMKYPHIFKGAIASSAPILQFEGITPCSVFSQIVTQVFRNVSQTCSDNIRKSWDAMVDKSKSVEGLQWLTETFRLCHPLQTEADIQELIAWFSEVYSNLAMVNYPYPTKFLEPLPAWPVKEACSRISGQYASDDELLEALSVLSQFYYNYTGDSKCLDLDEMAANGTLDSDLWDFQACSEMVMPMCSDGVSDMFLPSPWNLTLVIEECQNEFNVTPQPFMVETIYGGKCLSPYSNIVFTNGMLDPWSGGGVLESVSTSIVSVLIPEAAHHLDLRASHPSDSSALIVARELEKSFIRLWTSAHDESDFQLLDNSV